jgi:hypothetical protein
MAIRLAATSARTELALGRGSGGFADGTWWEGLADRFYTEPLADARGSDWGYTAFGPPKAMKAHLWYRMSSCGGLATRQPLSGTGLRGYGLVNS